MKLGTWHHVAHHYENEICQFILDSGVDGPDRFSAGYPDINSRLVFVSVHPRLDQAMYALAEVRERLTSEGFPFIRVTHRPLPPKVIPQFPPVKSSNREAMTETQRPAGNSFSSSSRSRVSGRGNRGGYVTPPLCAMGCTDIDPDQRFQGAPLSLMGETRIDPDQRFRGPV